MRIAGESPSYELVPVAPSPPTAGGRAAKSADVAFARVLRGLGGAIDKGEGLMAATAHGQLGSLDSGQLIALQVGIYRYSEAVDLVAKLVERASTAVKTVISPH